MPLYLSDDAIDAFVAEEVTEALRAIKQQTADVAVTPAIALSLIRQHFQPLIPAEHRHLLYKRGIATWDGLFGIYASLGGGLSTNNAPLLFEVMTAVHLIHAHTTRPPREYTFPTVIEVTYFLHMCNYLGIPVQHALHLEGHINPFNFCTLCWRHPLPGRKLCAHHAPNAPLQGDGDDVWAAAARYKSGVRQRERFDTAVNRILTQEVTEFHEGLFTPVVLLPKQGVATWLTERRPHIWQQFGERQQEINDDNAIEALLGLLHPPEGLPSRAYRTYVLINQHLRQHPLLIWPMLLRAEGWYQSREDLRGLWGGKRLGAGRPAKTAKL